MRSRRVVPWLAFCWNSYRSSATICHGVAQSFPDAMHAQEKLRGKGQDIKVIYGVEAYFVNDLAKSQAVQGQCQFCCCHWDRPLYRIY